MDENRTITGAEAIELIRRTRLIPGATFGVRFITCDLNRNRYGEIRVYERCRIRPPRHKESLTVDPDHYLFFVDDETDELRQCFKKLIRAVCLPPSNQWLTVKWFV
ncbi:hypothetical protein LJC00_03640 [Dysgonomonas sp. OttesenSCG-928-M03]|nr:hypothetical protein [Dysgonomonas sp. OttesenSCG-928-M03]